MEIEMSKETQNLLLATACGQTKHERSSKKKTDGTGVLQLRALHQTKKRDYISFIFPLQLCKGLLEKHWDYLCAYKDDLEHIRANKKEIRNTIFDGDYNPDGVEHLDNKKQLDVQQY